MKHSIDSENLGDLGLPMIDAIQKCVHCGFCLPACPTYHVLGQEMDSPRGRILLMKEVLEGNLEPGDAAPFIDRCLGCLACEPACPSGVPFGNLINAYRSTSYDRKSKALGGRIREFLVHQTVPFPGRFRFAAQMGKLMAPLSRVMPSFLRPMLDLIPNTIPKKQKLTGNFPAIGQCKGRVGLLAGCAQQVLAPEINAATIRVLNRTGFDVVVPQRQSCCGALDWHAGRLSATRKMAAKNFDAFPDDLDAIITNAAGCGSAIKEYNVVFRGTDLERAAKRFADRVVDVSVFLTRHEVPTARFETATRVGYHDACHLAHAQSIRSEPRALLGQIENIQLVPIQASDRCCGSAGTYNLQQPEIAEELGNLKAQTIVDSDCEIVVTGNIGCLVQIQKYLRIKQSPIVAMHTIEILDQALCGGRVGTSN